MNDTTLKKEDIPSEIIDEIESHGYSIDWKYYRMTYDELGEDIKQMVTRKLDHVVKHDDYELKTVMDPDNFEPKEIYSNSQEQFMIRGIFDNENSVAYPWMIISMVLTASPDSTKGSQ